MITTHKHKNITWIDIQSPTEDEARQMIRNFGIHELVAKEILEPSARSKVDPYQNHIYLILHFPIFNHEIGGKDMYEIDFVVGKDFIITTTYRDVPALENFKNIFDHNLQLEKDSQLKHAGFVFYFLIQYLYENLEENLIEMDNDTKIIEEGVFSGKQKQMLESIAHTNHFILDFRLSLKDHRGLLISFENVGREFFGHEFSHYLGAINGMYKKVWNRIEAVRETMIDLREMNDTLLTTKTNEIMKNLTIMAFITFPLTLVATIFGMNTHILPLVGLPHDFWIIFLIMLSGVLGMVLWFRRKGWM